jgi:anthranilate phosphoribosyltransferase
MQITNLDAKLNKGESLSGPEMTGAMEEIISGTLETGQIEGFLLALRKKGESVTEIAAAARVMRAHALKLSRSYPELLDTCGTGGDGKYTLNVSTLAALVACAAGARVAKHGNRSVSSVCGSADLLELLGVAVDLEPAAVERMISATGFGFFFAPRFHPAVKHAMPARKNIKGKTLFNILGPLSNPAGACHQLLGVYEERLVETCAGVLGELGSKRALVVHGADGLDEISISGTTIVAELTEGVVNTYTISPEEFGISKAPAEALYCAKKEENKECALQILKGRPGPGFDIVRLNAAAALYAAGKAVSIQEGVLAATKALISGAAFKKLEEITRFRG